ncbi:MAG TPA: glucose 1-dehydrogenase [Kiloniellales bacterium]|jgi:NAD(P)-dependent dehydrogenase (short-subunit alcohol dehydrogenase family)
MFLKDKIAIVTGGSQGIGAALALGFSREGATVAIVNRSHQDRAAKVLKSIEAAGGKAAAFRADCSQVSEIEKVVGEIVQRFGGVDILVNNAGVFRPMPIEDTTEAVWDEQLDLNLKGGFFFVRAVLPFLRKRGGGKIINISSIAGEAGFPNSAAYCASKGGLSNMTRAMALELAAANINVNALSPGNIKTPMNENLRADPAWNAKMRERTPSGDDFLAPEDLVGAALFLASDASRKMHGQVISVDGGWSAW